MCVCVCVCECVWGGGVLCLPLHIVMHLFYLPKSKKCPGHLCCIIHFVNIYLNILKYIKYIFFSKVRICCCCLMSFELSDFANYVT